jgi:hypothetical protein
MTASPKTHNFRDIEATTSSKAKKFTLHNKGSSAAVIGAIAPPPGFVLSNDNCSNQIVELKRKCTFKVSFAPASPVGDVSGNLSIPYNGRSPSITLKADGTTVSLSAPKTKRFAKTAAGSTSKAKIIMITNKSTAAVQLESPAIGGDFTQVSGEDTCANTTLEPKSKGKCTVEVDFAPAAGSSGEQTGTLSYDFTYGTNNGSVSVALEGKVK